MKFELFIQKILNLIYPQKCPHCQNLLYGKQLFCDDCESKLIRKILITKIFDENDEKNLIANCVSPFEYSGCIRSAIKKFKFRNCINFANAFSEEMFKVIKIFFKNEKFDAVTSVPLSKIRLKERQYNQSELLAKNISKFLNLPYCELLVKIKNNQPQYSLNFAKRFENVKNVYDFSFKTSVKNKNILLCDDIVTTGNTLKECIKVLYKNGACKVCCATLAKTYAKK
jgi:ComF family protein